MKAAAAQLSLHFWKFISRLAPLQEVAAFQAASMKAAAAQPSLYVSNCEPFGSSQEVAAVRRESSCADVAQCGCDGDGPLHPSHEVVLHVAPELPPASHICKPTTQFQSPFAGFSVLSGVSLKCRAPVHVLLTQNLCVSCMTEHILALKSISLYAHPMRKIMQVWFPAR